MSVHMIYYKDGAKRMRPVLTREEYLSLRNGGEQRRLVERIRAGEESLKHKLVQMNYSCLPNEDGSLKGSKTMSTTVGMDIDHLTKEEMPAVRERILQKKEELGLLMLEESARGGGYHLVFRRRPELSQEENLKWASELLEVKYDDGAKDITRVFFTTTGSAEDLLFLDDEIFRLTPSRLTPSRLTPSPSLLREGSGQTQGQIQTAEVSTPLSHREGKGESLEGQQALARIDKWLWAARIFKTRSIAADAIKNGRVTIGGVNVKPSRMVKAGETVSVRKPPVTYSFKILKPIEQRVGAKLLPEVYENVTTADQYELLEMNRISGFVNRARGTGRPTKKERRALDEFIGPSLEDFDDFDWEE